MDIKNAVIYKLHMHGLDIKIRKFKICITLSISYKLNLHIILKNAYPFTLIKIPLIFSSSFNLQEK